VEVVGKPDFDTIAEVCIWANGVRRWPNARGAAVAYFPHGMNVTHKAMDSLSSQNRKNQQAVAGSKEGRVTLPDFAR
jgi:hypothetical protein